jgi:hypothetical protein
VDDPDVKLLVFIVLGAALAGALWFFKDEIFPSADAPPVVQTAPAIEQTPEQVGPIHPISSLGSASSLDGELVELPPLDDSDSYFLLALVDSFGPDIGNVLVNEALIDKFVATVDNLTRSHVAEILRPVDRLPGVFSVESDSGDAQLYLNPENYARYDALVNLITKANLETVAAMYRRFYPLFQESYVRLGYPNGYFNDRVVEVIDHLLLTPDPDQPIGLVRPHVLYEFADADLQARSSGQKLLLRMGSDHAARIKQVLRELRLLIARSPG